MQSVFASQITIEGARIVLPTTNFSPSSGDEDPSINKLSTQG